MKFDDLILFLNDNRIEYQLSVNIAEYVSFKVGGVGTIIAFPSTQQQLCDLICFVNNKMKYFILGCGTNCYFSDYEGIIISTKKLNIIFSTNNKLMAECGASLTKCALHAYQNSLTGIEFLYGIPGSVGGGLYMNASAFGGMISQVVTECTAFNIDTGKTLTLSNCDMHFEPKKSIFMDCKIIVLSAVFDLSLFDKKIIKKTMDNFLIKRYSSQPLNLPNAGSAFKRPKNAYASELIDKAGLMGVSVGDAEISTKHAGFIINKGNATSSDVNSLIGLIKTTIKNKFDVDLEEEIIYVE